MERTRVLHDVVRVPMLLCAVRVVVAVVVVVVVSGSCSAERRGGDELSGRGHGRSIPCASR